MRNPADLCAFCAAELHDWRPQTGPLIVYDVETRAEWPIRGASPELIARWAAGAVDFRKPYGQLPAAAVTTYRGTRVCGMHAGTSVFGDPRP